MRGSHLQRLGAARSQMQRRKKTHSLYHTSFETLECRSLLSVNVVSNMIVQDDWGSGFHAELRLTNREATSFSPWRLEFELPANITSIWNANITARDGNRYTVEGASWNQKFAAGDTLQFGFIATKSGLPPSPTNLLLNGKPFAGNSPQPPQLPKLSFSDVSVLEGDSGTRQAIFTATLSAPSTRLVSVLYQTADGTANAGSDYRTTSGMLHFGPGQTRRTISVPVFGDRDVEADETFFLQLSQPTGVTLAQTRATATITNDDIAPEPSGDFQYRVLSDWGSGFTAEITIRNSSPRSVENWRLEFDFANQISSLWNGTLEQQAGNHYQIKSVDYNRVIPANGTVTVGFVAQGKSATNPLRFALTSAGGQEPTNRPPTAVNDAVFTLIGQQLLVDVLANDSDPDGDTLTLISAGQPTHGTTSIVGNAVRYVPAAGFTGQDTFTYEIRDAADARSRATVLITVSNVTVANPDQMFAPYVDMTLWPTYDLVAAARSQQIQYFTLAFIVADAQQRPSWGGYSEYALGSEFAKQIGQQIAGIRALGGDVIVSFGGAANRELAEVITNTSALQAAYQQVIDAYGLTHLDFDIEGAAAAHRTSIDRRNDAIAALQRSAEANGRTLTVSYTLPVLPTGLTPDGLYVLQSAVARGVRLDVVNIMAMDYGGWAAPNPQGRMGDYAIQAATSLHQQLRSLYGTAKSDEQLWALVGITPMIGVNDVTTEIFDQQEAREVLAFAEERGIGRLSFWSLNRDQQNPAGVLSYVDLKSSSILQSPFEFSQIFGTFDDK